MSVEAGFAVGRPFTVRDLEAIPEDGHRYELIDGALIVTPAPGCGGMLSPNTKLTDLNSKKAATARRLPTSGWVSRPTGCSTRLNPDG